MARIFNHREGFTSKDDILPQVFYHNFKGGHLDGPKAINKKEFEKAIKLRYELIDWNADTGTPIPAKIIELGLDWLIDEEVIILQGTVLLMLSNQVTYLV